MRSKQKQKQKELDRIETYAVPWYFTNHKKENQFL